MLTAIYKSPCQLQWRISANNNLGQSQNIIWKQYIKNEVSKQEI